MARHGTKPVPSNQESAGIRREFAFFATLREILYPAFGLHLA